MTMKTVAITGAAGYLGGRLLARLAADPAIEEIVGLDVRPLPGGSVAKSTFYRMDVRDPELTEVLARHRVDALVHTAFVLLPPPRRLKEMHHINVGGTDNVLRAAARTGVRRLLFVSSTTVYGAWPDNPVPLTEEHAPRPDPAYPYAEHKGQAEALWQSFGREHPEAACVILRPPGIVGQNMQGPLAQLLRSPRSIIIDGGRAPGQFVHEDDVAALVILALKAGACGVFNATPDDWLPWRDIWRGVGRPLLDIPWTVARPLFGSLWRLGLLGHVTHPGQVNLARFPFVAHNGKARRELGWRPRHTTVEALQDFLTGGQE